MSDSFTETSSQSIFGRLGNAIKGILFGIILIPLSIILLTWNEGRAVKTTQSLKEGAAAVVSVATDQVKPENEGKLVHLSGEVKTSDTLTDPVFHVSQNAIRLSRKAEMFQWKEKKDQSTHKKLGGGTETTTTYSYSKEWSDHLIKSSEFKHPEGHENPTTMEMGGNSMTAENVMLGAFKLPLEIISMMKGDQPLPLAAEKLPAEQIPGQIKGKIKSTGEAIFIGNDPSSPEVGDQKITFTVLKPAWFSVIARQKGSTLESYPTKAGRQIERVESGQVSATEMFEHAERENTLLTWGLRFGGWLLMALGIGLILSPLSVIADVIPMIGDIVGMGTTLAALIIASFGSCLVIAIAWFSVRPVLSIALIASAIGAIIVGKRMASEKKTSMASQAA